MPMRRITSPIGCLEVDPANPVFARRTIALGAIGESIINHATSVHAEDPDFNKIFTRGKADTETLVKLGIPPVGVRGVINNYRTTAKATRSAYERYDDDADFFHAALGVRPNEEVIAHRLAGGVVFEVDRDDYYAAYISNTSLKDKDQAARRAASTTGMAFGGKKPVGALNRQEPILLPVSMEVRRLFTASSIGFMELNLGEKTGTYGLFDYDSYGFSYTSQDGKRKTISAYPKRSEASGPYFIERTTDGGHDVIWPDENGVALTGEGNFELAVIDGELTIGVSPEANGRAFEVMLTTDRKPGVRDHSDNIRRHEVQHHLNKLYAPQVPNEFRHEGTDYRTADEAVAGIARLTINNVMADQARDEFLASLAEGVYRQPSEIASMLADQVENQGDCYDYFTMNEVVVSHLVKHDAADFDEVGVETIRDRVIEDYRPMLRSVADSITEHAHQSSQLKRLTPTELVALLAPHHITRWGSALKAVEFYAQAAGASRLYQLAS